jgi:formylglycine-generating enzyme required for sulfatase activity
LFFGQTVSTDQANYDGEHTYGGGAKGISRKKTTPVGSFPANAFGLFDVHGNVWEWCPDGYSEYSHEEIEDPQNNSENVRLMRGGSWHYYPSWCRSAFRNWNAPSDRADYFGCRLVCLD